MPLYGYVWLSALVEKKPQVLVTLVSLDWKSMNTYLRQRKYIILPILISGYNMPIFTVLTYCPTHFLPVLSIFLPPKAHLHQLSLLLPYGLFFLQCVVVPEMEWPLMLGALVLLFPKPQNGLLPPLFRGGPTSCATHCKKLFERSKTWEKKMLNERERKRETWKWTQTETGAHAGS